MWCLVVEHFCGAVILFIHRNIKPFLPPALGVEELNLPRSG